MLHFRFGKFPTSSDPVFESKVRRAQSMGNKQRSAFKTVIYIFKLKESSSIEEKIFYNKWHANCVQFLFKL